MASSTHRPSPIVLKCSTIFLTIQDDSGGEVVVLRGDCIGHCEKKSSHEHVSFMNGLQSCLNLPIKSNVNGNKERESTVSCILILIYCLDEKFVVVHNKYSKIPSSSMPLQLMCEGHVFFV